MNTYTIYDYDHSQNIDDQMSNSDRIEFNMWQKDMTRK